MPGRLRQLAPALGIFAAFFLLYSHSIDLRSANLLWHNYIFDADVDRIAADLAGRQNLIVFGRHPLFVLTVIWPVSVIAHLHVGTLAAMRLWVAGIAALGVVAAWTVFRRILGQPWAALVFTCMYGLASVTWLLASLPETFAMNAAVVAVCLAMQDPGYARPVHNPGRFLLYVFFSVAAFGTTVVNAAYVGLGYLGRALQAQPSWPRRMLSLLAAAVSVALVFVACSLLQKWAFSSRIVHGTGIVVPWGAVALDGFLRFDRPFILKDTLSILRYFVVDNLVAPGAIVDVLDTSAGPNSMIQYGTWTAPTYLLGVVAVGLFAVLTAVRSTDRRACLTPVAGLALSYIGFNVLLHHFYRGNGQPFVFTVQTVQPTLVLLAHVYAASDLRPRLVLAGVALGAVVINSIVFLHTVRTALALPCAHKLGDVCTEWAASDVDPRYKHGLEGYTTSGLYLGDRGNEALAQGHREEAVRFFREALDRRPDLLWVERNMGIVLLDLGRLGEAGAHLKHVLDRAPYDQLAREVLDVVEQRARQMAQPADASGGWYGRLSGPDYAVAATQIDPGSRAGRVLYPVYGRPLVLFILSVDNRAGHGDLELDLSGLKVQLADGTSHPAPARQDVLSSTGDAREEFLRRHGQPYRIPMGRTFSGAQAFLAADEKIEQVAGLMVRLSGKEVVIPGRYLSAREKR